jgi:hypothetical protein
MQERRNPAVIQQPGGVYIDWSGIGKFLGEKYLAVADDFVFETAIPEATYILRQRSSIGLSTEPNRVHMGGGNSGFGAFNLAFLKQPKRIILLGYDYCSPGQHWHGQYPWNQGPSRHGSLYGRWAEQFTHCIRQLKDAGVEVLNASPKSAITAFPKIELSEVPL